MVSSAVSMVSSLESSALGTVTCASVADSTSSDYELQFNRWGWFCWSNYFMYSFFPSVTQTDSCYTCSVL